ncbi:cell division protein FtsQ/DivIB [Vulgatibacter sp.]|uniref:cell division protein FtsQ/DivIB n=1 Tax=Vulgatibacter sp. TaxID=1971226 RepID=UPI0035618B26
MSNRRKIDRAEQARRALSLTRRLAIFTLRVCGLLAAVAAVCGGGWAAIRWVTTTPRLAIVDFEISGNDRAREGEIRQLLGIAPGENLLLADLGSAHDRLLDHPWIREVSLERRFPQGVDIAVVERQPKALVDLGHLYLLDERGEAFKRAQPGDPLDLPVITGLPREDWSDKPEETRLRLDEALHALGAWAERERSRSLPVAEVHLDEGEGVTLYLGERGPAVKLGHGDFERKLDRLARVLAEVERRGERVELVRLDNRARPGWIAARLAEATGPERKTATP